MHRNKLLNLLANNARKGEFRAEGNTIFLYDMIVSSKAEAEWFGGVDAETFVQTLAGMTGDVSLRINSPGGDVFAARAMAQAIREHGGTVTAYVDGYAASAASFISSVADKTVMAPGAMIMIHKAWSIAMGNADDFSATATLLNKIDETIVQTYVDAAEKRGVDAPDFAAMMAAETWLNGQEAMAAGLADETIVDSIKVSTKASAQWDFSAYANAPTADGGAVEIEIDPTLSTLFEVKITSSAERAAAELAVTNEIERRHRIAALRLRSPA